MGTEESIKEIQTQFGESIAMWADVFSKAEKDDWALLLDYSEETIQHTFTVFTHVMQNIGIKTGHINMENVYEVADKYAQAMSDCFGIEIHKKDIS